MEKVLKTYGMRGVMEYHMIIPVGKSSMHVQFSGGNMEGYGNTPAEFSTSDQFTQLVIENSQKFKEGKIYVVRAVELEASEKTPIHAENKEAEQETSEENTTSGNEVRVSCLEDAKEYLVDKHGYIASKLRSKASVDAAAAEQGIVFVYE